MIYKILIKIFGDNFYPDEVLRKIQQKFIVGSKYKPGDKKFPNSDQILDYGFVILMHPYRFAIGETVEEYENSIVQFLDDNMKVIKEFGGEEFELNVEVYYDGGQCNFEIFNKYHLNKLSKHLISISVSVYKLSIEEYKKWEDEIKLIWNSKLN